MRATDPLADRATQPDVACDSCGAGTPSCASVQWLRGRPCCEDCTHSDADSEVDQ